MRRHLGDGPPLDTVESPARRDRFRTHIHLNSKGEATDAHGWSIPDAISKYITCDGLLTPVFIDGSIPSLVGRIQRMIPQPTRPIVLLCDQSCRVHGCNETHHLEEELTFGDRACTYKLPNSAPW